MESMHIVYCCHTGLYYEVLNVVVCDVVNVHDSEPGRSDSDWNLIFNESECRSLLIAFQKSYKNTSETLVQDCSTQYMRLFCKCHVHRTLA